MACETRSSRGATLSRCQLDPLLRGGQEKKPGLLALSRRPGTFSEGESTPSTLSSERSGQKNLPEDQSLDLSHAYPAHPWWTLRDVPRQGFCFAHKNVSPHPESDACVVFRWGKWETFHISKGRHQRGSQLASRCSPSSNVWKKHRTGWGKSSCCRSLLFPLCDRIRLRWSRDQGQIPWSALLLFWRFLPGWIATGQWRSGHLFSHPRKSRAGRWSHRSVGSVWALDNFCCTL